MKQLEEKLCDMKRQLDRALSSKVKQETENKFTILILDSGANPSFVNHDYGSPLYLNPQVRQ